MYKFLSWFLFASLTSRHSSQDQRRGTGIVIQVYLQRVFLTIVISPGPYVLQDEEEGIKEEEG